MVILHLVLDTVIFTLVLSYYDKEDRKQIFFLYVSIYSLSNIFLHFCLFCFALLDFIVTLALGLALC